jgi:heat shock protein HslJ
VRQPFPLALTAALLLTGCETALENTEWKLVQLGGESVAAGDRQREPSLILQADTKRVAGFGGCNRFNGAYTLDGSSLALGPLASTRMACLEGMELEQAFHAALSRAARWRIVGSQLEILDTAGNAVARFEVRR